MSSENDAASVRLSRRSFAAAGLATLLAPARAGAATASRRIVSLDYGVTTTLLAIGITPVAIADADEWPIWVVSPPLPAGVANVGDDLDVNLEVLARLKPDLIFSTPYLEGARAVLETIAPVETLTIYAPDGEPLPRSIAATRRLGETLDRQAAAEKFLAESEAAFDGYAERLARLSPPPLALINHLDARHARVYGSHSLYDNVLDRLGLTNAWTGETNYWGFNTIGLERLATMPADVRLIAFEPIPPDVPQMQAASPLWQSLPFVAAGRISVLPGVLMFGMLPSALRFADLLTAHLEAVAR